jgi:hypothetical protein
MLFDSADKVVPILQLSTEQMGILVLEQLGDNTAKLFHYSGKHHLVHCLQELIVEHEK